MGGQGQGRTEVHSAPLYSVQTLGDEERGGGGQAQGHGGAQSASAHQGNFEHFSLSTALLSIPQHPQNQMRGQGQGSVGMMGQGQGQGQQGSGMDHGHGQGQSGPYNFLWWYPEVKFCE